MTNLSPQPISFPPTVASFSIGRYYAFAISFFCLLIFATITRVALFVGHSSEIGSIWPAAALAFAVGFVFDFLVGLWCLLPFGVFLLLFRERWLGRRIWSWISSALFIAYFFGLAYLVAIEWYFFDEFNGRFNTVAVDYWLYPHEVFVNLWQTYPLAQILATVGLVTAVVFIAIRRRYLHSLSAPTAMKLRVSVFLTHAALLSIGSFTMNSEHARISENRVLNEIAMNGLYSFVNAALTHELDYDANYIRMDEEVAFQRLRGLLARDGNEFAHSADSQSIDRVIRPVGAPRPLNVVIVLEESFGSKFVQSLDSGGPGVAPQFEELANAGVLFTNIYATGNRTVRGIEATLASFPPIPGPSIVRRQGGEHVFTLPALLKSIGYSTAFVYGGYSYFDNMGAFALANGFDQVIDRTTLKRQTFTTIWGVCDEDLFDNSLEILDSLSDLRRPFFTALLTVSNHPPFKFPDGRIHPPSGEGARERAVRYADFALGEFMRSAASHPFFDSTLFVVLGDHGARVYGAQQIPMDSYRIPVLFYGPHIVGAGQRISTLGSQLDVAPTIMGLLRVPYTSRFFGHDWFSAPTETGRAVMSHNYDLAIFNGTKMASLGLRHSAELWEHDPRDKSIRSLPVIGDSAEVLDAIAYFQSAHRLYIHQKLYSPLARPVGTEN